MTATITDLIRPIIHETYGDGVYANGLIEQLAERITSGDWGSRGRQYNIMLTCWDWMPGGSTAAHVAQRIEAILTTTPKDITA